MDAQDLPVVVEVPPGLAGVVVARTSIGDVRGDEGFYQYRDRSAVELARTASFEDVWHLLVVGDWPTPAQSADFAARIAAARGRDDILETARLLFDAAGDPVAALKAAWPVLAARRGMRPLYDLDEAGRLSDAVELAALVPVLLGAVHELSAGREPAASEPGAGTVADYLARVTGHGPDEWAVRALSAYLIAVMDHGFNASAFTARVIASTGADLAGCLAGALDALTGPLHGGAPARALDGLDQISLADDIEPWIRAELAAGHRLMGFGHAVYRTADPRSELMKQYALERGGERVELAVRFEEAAQRLLAEAKPGRRLHTNVEFYAAVVMEACGIPREMLTPTFAVGRVIGWTAHVLEQAREKKIIRPSARYVGPPLAQRPAA